MKGTHLPKSQQPPGQLAGLHTGIEVHAPLVQLKPGEHGTHTLPLMPQTDGV